MAIGHSAGCIAAGEELGALNMDFMQIQRCCSGAWMADGSRWGDQGDGKSTMLTQGCRQDVEDVRGKNLIYYLRDFQTRAPLTVVLVCFAQGVGTYL